MPLRNIIIIVTAAVISLACYEKATHNRYLTTLSHAMDVIEDNYVEELPTRELFENAMRGMVTGLDDYSDYISPDQFEQFQQTIDQEFVGIGIVVEGPPDADELRVVSPVYDSPAYRAGMRAGDVILEIDGESTSGMLLAQAVKKIKGPPKTTVSLLVRRAEADETVTLEVTRDRIRTQSVLGDTLKSDGSWDFRLAQNPEIGLIRITSFGEFTAEELGETLRSSSNSVKSLILDLRGNVGGLLSAAVSCSDMFIDEGLIVTTRGRQEWNEEKYFASPAATLVDHSLPIAVLIDRYSASAAEIMAACLKDHDRAVVVGERSWGKGTVQNVILLEQGRSALKLTTASYWRPNGKNIHRGRKATEEDDWGVRPTGGLEVKLTDDQYRQLYEQRRQRDILRDSDAEAFGDELPEPMVDPQLQAAIDYLGAKQSPAES